MEYPTSEPGSSNILDHVAYGTESKGCIVMIRIEIIIRRLDSMRHRLTSWCAYRDGGGEGVDGAHDVGGGNGVPETCTDA
jgi:hypothetical protein